MIPFEAWLFLPATSGGVEVWQEDAGEPVAQDAVRGLPAIGASVVVPIVRLPRTRLVVELGADGRTRHWDVAPTVTATYGMISADFGWRWGPGQPRSKPLVSVAGEGRRGVDPWWGARSGLRLGYLSAPPWEPWVAWGFGASTSVGLSASNGVIRPMAEVRLGLDLVAEAVTGTLDTSRVDMGWTWTPMALTASARVGISFP